MAELGKLPTGRLGGATRSLSPTPIQTAAAPFQAVAKLGDQIVQMATDFGQRELARKQRRMQNEGESIIGQTMLDKRGELARSTDYETFPGEIMGSARAAGDVLIGQQTDGDVQERLRAVLNRNLLQLEGDVMSRAFELEAQDSVNGLQTALEVSVKTFGAIPVGEDGNQAREFAFDEGLRKIEEEYGGGLMDPKFLAGVERGFRNTIVKERLESIVSHAGEQTTFEEAEALMKDNADEYLQDATHAQRGAALSALETRKHQLANSIVAAHKAQQEQIEQYANNRVLVPGVNGPMGPVELTNLGLDAGTVRVYAKWIASRARNPSTTDDPIAALRLTMGISRGTISDEKDLRDAFANSNGALATDELFRASVGLLNTVASPQNAMIAGGLKRTLNTAEEVIMGGFSGSPARDETRATAMLAFHANLLAKVEILRKDPTTNWSEVFNPASDKWIAKDMHAYRTPEADVDAAKQSARKVRGQKGRTLQDIMAEKSVLPERIRARTPIGPLTPLEEAALNTEGYKHRAKREGETFEEWAADTGFDNP